MTMKPVRLFVATIVTAAVSPAWAQDTKPATDHSQHSMPMDPSQHGSTPAQTGQMPVHLADGAGHDSMSMSSMQGGSPPPDARDPHAYSGGHDFGPYELRLADTHSFGSLLIDNLDAVYSDDNTSTAYDLQAWYGRTYDRAVLKAEGEVDNGGLEEARTELLWGHAIASFWDTQLGVRYDSGEGLDRAWLAFGVQGLAPYWFELDLAGYVGEEGRTALRLDASYDLLLTQRWILQPRVEADAYGRSDADRGLGSGLSDLTAGLRLRYEIRRELAPYVGIEWRRQFGETADLTRAAGGDPSEMRWVAGLRFWF